MYSSIRCLGDLPILIEIVDSEEKVEAFLATVDELVTEGLVALEAVRVHALRKELAPLVR